ncbi:MAG TPA: 30S ribosomal protein S27e, partial [Candidatus Nanoarchaeia archaeon]|nr:30S ribosomal protein S27e [Candidatus Nanoarchaeia archaeon]
EGGAQVNMTDETKSKFVKIRCEKCKNEQIIFNKPSTEVKCLVCSEVLVKPTGGTVKIKGALEILG